MNLAERIDARFTDADRAHWRELGRASRIAQGLPEQIEDPLVYDQIAALIGDDIRRKGRPAA